MERRERHCRAKEPQGFERAIRVPKPRSMGIVHLPTAAGLSEGISDILILGLAGRRVGKNAVAERNARVSRYYETRFQFGLIIA